MERSKRLTLMQSGGNLNAIMHGSCDFAKIFQHEHQAVVFSVRNQIASLSYKLLLKEEVPVYFCFKFTLIVCAITYYCCQYNIAWVLISL